DLLYPSVSISLFHTSYGGHRGLRSSPTRRSSDLMRVRVSVPPPGGKGEIKVMDPSFREEAEAAPLTTSAPAMSRDLIERLNIMSLQFGLIRMRCWDWQRLPGSRTARQGCPRQSARQPRGND